MRRLSCHQIPKACAMPGHRFALGDRVRLVASAFSVVNPNDVYAVFRQLPFHDGISYYRLRREGNSEERAASEDQLIPAFLPARQSVEEMRLQQRNLQRTRNADAQAQARRAVSRKPLSRNMLAR